MSEIDTAETAFLLLLSFVLIFGIFARKSKVPYPIVMVIGGLALTFFPMVPHISLNPDLIFTLVLPPLLYSSAWQTSWRDFRYHLVDISLLAFGLVGFTVVGVALAAPHVFAQFDWRLGLVLGAVVAPTDAIAATAMARRIGLPGRIVDILEGESLLNDATGLLALEFATGILVNDEIPSVAHGVVTLLWLTAGGVAIGVCIGWIVDFLERRIDDAAIEITLSILVPYLAYLAADAAHASGVLSVVCCGLFLTGRSANFFSPSVRMKVWSVWESLTFILNGFVFVLIGLQFPQIRVSIHEYGLPTVILYGGVFSLLLIALRFVWVFPSAHIAHFVQTRILHHKEHRTDPRRSAVIGWTGMRGVVSLAAALALPDVLANNSPFPHRGLIVVLTFCVILVTLVLQGLALPPFIRILKLSGPQGPDCEELEARNIMAETALSHLESAEKRDKTQMAEVYEDLIQHYRHRMASLREDDESEDALRHRRYLDLSLEALRVERTTAIRLRDEGRINDAVLRKLEREMDLVEARLSDRHEHE